MLDLKIESMRARGEISAEERNIMLSALKAVKSASPKKKSFISPLRLFLAGMVCGVSLAYLVWGIWGGLPDL